MPKNLLNGTHAIGKYLIPHAFENKERYPMPFLLGSSSTLCLSKYLLVPHAWVSNFRYPMPQLSTDGTPCLKSICSTLCLKVLNCTPCSLKYCYPMPAKLYCYPMPQ